MVNTIWKENFLIMCSKLCLNARDSGHFAQLLLICRNYSLQEAVAQGKNPSAAASLRLNASRSTKTLAIDPLISKKQITQSGPSE